MQGFIGGWLAEQEDRDALAVSSFDDWEDQVKGLFAAPDEIDPRPYIRVEDQAQQGSCQGQAVTSCVEWCYKIATGGTDLQLSRQYAYIVSQRKDRISGDRGSTIQAGSQVAREGIPREQFWPYTGRYHTSPPGGWEACKEDAKNYVIKSHSVLKSYQQVFDYIASGVGGVELGISWGVPDAPVCESFRPSGGGHAIAFLGYSKRKDSKGRHYLWLLNSWGERWGNRGWCEVSPAAVDQMFGHRYTVMIGLSDLQGDGVKPRPVDWAKESPYIL